MTMIGRRFERLSLLFLMGLGFCLRLYHLGFQSLWNDEALTGVISGGPFQDTLVYATKVDVHPPLYIFLMSGWAYFAGNTAFALRFPSLLFGVISIFIMMLPKG